ncbi:MAG: 4-(cytidine 5'-diphospho)-2-C-methyl-D-erythritol kinase [Clostridia bacterium]|nr:4-(cytidine 5'-diphospho)-2-C-methyl-D-erythritol kinase [Clostridia bacterium]
MKTVKIKAYAKVNLTLEIVGQTADYHALDSLVASVDLYDLIVLKQRKDKLSSVTMKGLGSESIPPENNNALKAAEAFSKTFNVGGADITVYKNIPIGAGLGGSSADAAGVLNGMAKLYNMGTKEELKTLAEKLGSDTAYMLSGGFARMQGRGEKLTPLKVDKKLHFLLLCPPNGVSSKACYQKYDELPRTLEWRESQTEGCIKALAENNVNEGGRYLMNDLFVPALHLNSEVEAAKKEALSFSPLGATMTGSGSGVIALFETKELCEWAKSRYRGKAHAYVVSTLTPDYENSKQKTTFFRNPFALSDKEIEGTNE